MEKQRSYHKWTTAELALLRERAPECTVADLRALFPDRSYQQVYSALYRRGLSCRKAEAYKTNDGQVVQYWTPAEDQVIREHYRSHTATQMARMLPGRSKGAVRLRAELLGIPLEVHGSTADWTTVREKSEKPEPMYRHWTPAEDEVLREHGPKHTAGELVKLGVLPGRSINGIYNRVRKLGVRLGGVK